MDEKRRAPRGYGRGWSLWSLDVEARFDSDILNLAPSHILFRPNQHCSTDAKLLTDDRTRARPTVGDDALGHRQRVPLMELDSRVLVSPCHLGYIDFGSNAST
jgi:hypothetical protein